MTHRTYYTLGRVGVLGAVVLSLLAPIFFAMLGSAIVIALDGPALRGGGAGPFPLGFFALLSVVFGYFYVLLAHVGFVLLRGLGFIRPYTSNPPETATSST